MCAWVEPGTGEKATRGGQTLSAVDSGELLRVLGDTITFHFKKILLGSILVEDDLGKKDVAKIRVSICFSYYYLKKNKSLLLIGALTFKSSLWSWSLWGWIAVCRM